MYGKKQRIYQLMKLVVTSIVIGTGEYHLLCCHHVRIFKAAYHLSKLSNVNLEKILDNFMVLNQPWKTDWCINEETLDMKWITCNTPPEEVVFLGVFLEVIF